MKQRYAAAMPNVGPMELVIVLVVALIVLGPKRLPEVGRSLGNGLREFKDSLQNPDHDRDDETHLDIEEPPEPVTTAAATAPAAPESDEKSS
jgi:sec-independent protein translocase protein TatA